MFKFKHSTLITIGGALWMTMGIFLMNMGLRLIAEKSVIIAHTQEGGLLKSLSLSTLKNILTSPRQI
jgi:UDP-N-acetylglucosamine transferase subunit ALG13